MFVTFFFNRKEVFLFSWKKKRKEKNKKVSILLEVVDDANQEQIKKLLTSQVFGEKAKSLCGFPHNGFHVFNGLVWVSKQHANRYVESRKRKW